MDEKTSLAALHFCIIGTQHPRQRTSGLKNEMQSICERSHVVLIAEEVNANAPHSKQRTVGRDLAGTLRIHWLPIDMTFDEQRDACIFDDLEQEAASRMEGRNVYYTRANSMREDYWLQKIQDECVRLRISAGTVLIICGRNHQEFVADKAAKLGVGKVEPVEYPKGLKEKLPPLEIMP